MNFRMTQLAVSAAVIIAVCLNISSVKSRKLIIDGDPGVDDAAAIVLTLSGVVKNAPDLVALTLVEGNGRVQQEALNTLRILELMNRTDIPIYLGTDKPLIDTGDQVKDGFFGKDAFGNVPKISPRPSLMRLKKLKKRLHAANAIVRIAKANKGNITLVCLGPLTNLALALRLDSKLSSYLSKVVLLGGNMHGQGNISPAAEFNFFHDPEAAQIVINSDLSPIIVPWETLLDHTIPFDEYDAMMAMDNPVSKFLRSIGKFSNNFVRKSGAEYLFGDQVALAVAIKPDLILDMKRLSAQVELSGIETRGQLVVDWRPKYTEEQKGEAANVQIVTKYDVQALKKLMTEAVRN